MVFLMNKAKIALSFNSAIKTYDQAAELQKKIGNCLLGHNVFGKQNPKVILDLGCGTGYFANKLVGLFPQAAVYGLDIAKEMIGVAKNNYSAERLSFLYADVDNMQFNDSFGDLVFSNCVLQWMPDLSNSLREINRVLVEGGHLFFFNFCTRDVSAITRCL
jgi:malonyl-CoA O-methyltransferase